MSDSQFKPWSENPNAPKIPHDLYFAEKVRIAGDFIGAMLYGILTMLFFKSMNALLSPVHRRGERIKWGLVSYTVVMFSLATVNIAMNLHIESISFIDNREFPGVEGVFPPGPNGYLKSVYFKAINVVPNAAFGLNNWLADGLLLYRCYMFYSMNLWVIAFPFLMFLASVGVGILSIYPLGSVVSITSWGIVYFSITLSLNVLLTFMIVVRLALHVRLVRAATGSRAGLYRTIATMLVESSALFAVSSLLVIGLMAAHNPAMQLFSAILAETQVIAPLLIIHRVAKKSALTRHNIAPGSVSPFRAKSRRGELTDGSGSALSGGHPIRFVSNHGMSSVELGAGEDSVIDIRQDKV